MSYMLCKIIPAGVMRRNKAVGYFLFDAGKQKRDFQFLKGFFSHNGGIHKQYFHLVFFSAGMILHNISIIHHIKHTWRFCT